MRTLGFDRLMDGFHEFGFQLRRFGKSPEEQMPGRGVHLDRRHLNPPIEDAHGWVVSLEKAFAGFLKCDY